MKQMLVIILLVLHTAGTNACAQMRNNCDEILKRKIEIHDFEKAMKTFRSLNGCGLDSIDIALFCTPTILAGFVANTSYVDGSVTYGDFVKLLDSLLRMPVYIAMKDNTRKLYGILDKTASLENWDEDIKPLLALGMEHAQLEMAHALLEDTKYEKLTYRQLFYEQTSIEKTKEDNHKAKVADSVNGYFTSLKQEYALYCDTSKLKVTPIYHILAFRSYEEGITYAKKVGKPSIVYFECINCINCRKIESLVMNTREIQIILQTQYVMIDLVCDDRAKLPGNEQQFSKILQRKTETIGDKNVTLESDKYDAEYQPFFVMLDKNGKKIKTFQFTKDMEEFKSFLQSEN